MELELKHEQLLEQIHDAEHERLLHSKVIEAAKKDKGALQAMVEYLVTHEFLEYDNKDEAYYLTSEGYEAVEEFKSASKWGEEMANAEFEHRVRQNAKESRRKMWTILGGVLLVFLVLYPLSNISFFNNRQEFQFDKEMMENISEELQEKTDSILKLREMNVDSLNTELSN